VNKNLIILGTAGLVLGGLSLFTGKALAYRGDPSVQGPNYSVERHDAMNKAFEGNDYNAWKELTRGKGKVTQVITEQNFARFAEARKLALEGKTDEAKKIREELGLGLQNGSGQGMGRGCDRNTNL